MNTGLVGAAVNGWTSILSGGNTQLGAEVGYGLTYQPRTGLAQRGQENLLGPIAEKLEWAKSTLGEQGYERGGAIGGTIGYTAIDAISFLVAPEVRAAFGSVSRGVLGGAKYTGLHFVDTVFGGPPPGSPAAQLGAIDLWGPGVRGGPNKLTTAQRIAKLDLEGHAPIRHGGPNRVTDLQLEDRAVRGIDPASGTTFDAFNKFPDGSPKPHKVGRNATAFISEDALLQADDFARSSTQFQQNITTAITNGDIFVDPVEIPLRDVFGSNYQNYVRGVTRLGSKNNPTGHIPTDFTDGTLKAIYRLDQNGNVKLHTLYPNPKP